MVSKYSVNVYEDAEYTQEFFCLSTFFVLSSVIHPQMKCAVKERIGIIHARRKK